MFLFQSEHCFSVSDAAEPKRPFWNCDGNRLTVSDDIRQDSDDVSVGDAVLQLASVVAAHNIGAVFFDFHDTVQHILPAVAFIERYVKASDGTAELFYHQ